VLAYEQVLPLAAATWRQAANVLKAEGLPFKVHTPAGALRFASERSAQDFIEVTLDTSRRPVALVGRVVLARGGQVIDRETVVAEGDAVAEVDEQRLLEFLLEELAPFVVR
jgi:hypothetical protein